MPVSSQIMHGCIHREAHRCHSMFLYVYSKKSTLDFSLTEQLSLLRHSHVIVQMNKYTWSHAGSSEDASGSLVNDFEM